MKKKLYILGLVVILGLGGAYAIAGNSDTNVCFWKGRAMFFNGLPEMPISNITVKNVVMTEATDGVVISQVDGVTLENVYVESSKGNNILNVKNAKNLTVDGKVYEELGAKEEILSLK